jgi:hypothetical protein
MEHKSNGSCVGQCQIRATFAENEPVSRIFRHFLFQTAKRGIRLARNVKSYLGREEIVLVPSRNLVAHEFQEGQLVRVKPLEEILSIVDSTGRTNGCKFTKPMIRYCRREFRVVKRMTRFFDEAQWKMVKCAKLLLLEGSYCDGSGGPYTEGCDRMCFVFWREEWLEPVE